jgi:hypothetical protein
MVKALRAHPFQSDSDTELARLSRVIRTLKRSDEHHDLREAIECTLAFEDCYQHALLGFERILWLCRHHTATAITLAELDRDPVLAFVKANLSTRVRRLIDALDDGSTSAFRESLDRLSDVRRFLETASGAVGDHSAFIDALVNRHTDVQHGKFDRGRRKMPWLERNDSRISLTMTRAGGMNREASQPVHIAPHPYRLGATDALISASLKAAQS